MSFYQSAVYILTNKRNGTLYVEVTSNLPKRINEHKATQGSEFTKKYKLYTLVYAEVYKLLLKQLNEKSNLRVVLEKQKFH